MRILFTGASSFTGYWFIEELIKHGHEVVTIFSKKNDSYKGVRGLRVSMLKNICKPVWECEFGSSKFLDIIDSKDRWDLLCLHGAHVENYKNLDFDICNAFEKNTLNADIMLTKLKRKKLQKVIYTGSYFEQDEGGLFTKALSPYGMSKGFTSQYYEYLCNKLSINFSKFVIPNPFGPYEDSNFTSYLIESWASGVMPTVKTPNDVRDNIHISLLAMIYARFVSSDFSIISKVSPNGYIGSQLEFAKRFSREMGTRVDIFTEIKSIKQVVFSEPSIRFNVGTNVLSESKWDESRAWDDIGDYYIKKLKL